MSLKDLRHTILQYIHAQWVIDTTRESWEGVRYLEGYTIHQNLPRACDHCYIILSPKQRLFVNMNRRICYTCCNLLYYAVDN